MMPDMKEIRAIRKKYNMNRALFANFLHISPMVLLAFELDIHYFIFHALKKAPPTVKTIHNLNQCNECYAHLQNDDALHQYQLS